MTTLRSVLYASIFVLLISTAWLGRRGLVLSHGVPHETGTVLRGASGLDVSYAVKGTPQLLHVRPWLGERFQPGDHVVIAYLPEEPSRASVATFVQLWGYSLVSLGFLALVVVALVMTRDRTAAAAPPMGSPRRAV